MTTSKIMAHTLLATIPGLMLLSVTFGTGVIINVLAAAGAALLAEALVLRMRGLSPARLLDGTVVLTGTLLGLCLPPLLPLWMVCVGTGFAVVFGKHVYGGTGQNIFNPAMVGFAVLIVAFPLAMNQWPAAGAPPGLADTVSAKFSLVSLPAYDGVTAATPLDSYKFRESLTNEEHFATDAMLNWQAWAWINLAFLAGGAYLMARRIITWQAPVAMLVTIAALSLLFYDGGSSRSLGSPLFHLLSGATLMAACFIVTDPVTCPGQPLGRLVFGAGVGLVTFIIRTIGAYPEGFAFAVLLMNACSPLIDYLVVMRRTGRQPT